MRIIMRSYLKKWAFMVQRAMLPLLALLALGLCQPGWALTRAELYHVTAPATDRSEAAQTAAFQTAMKMVLVRVTGARSVEENAALAPLVANARRYVQQFRAAQDNQIWVAFDGPAIERWLTQNGQPVWGAQRPATVVWVAAQPATILTAENTSDLKLQIDEAATQRGLPLIWPSGADLAKLHVDFGTINAGSPAVLLDLARRLGGDSALIGRASNSSGAAAVRWTHLFQDRSSEYSGALEGVNRAADLYAGLFAASGALAPVDIEVSGVNDLKDYAGIQTWLESQTSISHVSVQALNGDVVRFRLATRGGAESLQRALSLNGRLKSLGPGENGVARFQLQRH
jgi:hypothetical protein